MKKTSGKTNVTSKNSVKYSDICLREISFISLTLINSIWKKNMRILICIIFGMAVMFKVVTASAIPTISVDLDPGTMGIQTSLTVKPGDSFTVNVVYTGDGITTFDTFMFDTLFNDLGAVLG